MDEYRFVGSHPDELDGGRPIEPGEFTGPIEVDDDHPQNQRLLEDGLLLKIEKKQQSKGLKAANDDNQEG